MSHTSVIRVLKEEINKAIQGTISPDEFEKWFENWFVDEFEKESAFGIDQSTYEAIANLYGDIAYFEPDEQIRQEHPSYYGQRRLIAILAQTLRTLSD